VLQTIKNYKSPSKNQMKYRKKRNKRRHNRYKIWSSVWLCMNDDL